MTLREEDGVQHIVAANTHASLLFFTDQGRVFQLKVYDIPDSSRTSKGLPVINLISLQPGETITTLLPVRDFSAGSYLFYVYSKWSSQTDPALTVFVGPFVGPDRHRAR